MDKILQGDAAANLPAQELTQSCTLSWGLFRLIWMTPTVVNLPVPAVIYADWLTYFTHFVSENREIYRSIRITRALFPKANLRFVGHSGLDDRKIFGWMDLVEAEFVI